MKLHEKEIIGSSMQQSITRKKKNNFINLNCIVIEILELFIIKTGIF